jgi:hypothetical protein
MSTRSKTEVYVPDFPGQLKSLRQTAGESEPSAGFGLWVLLSRNGVRLNWGDTEVLSGQALQFLYSRDPALAEGKSTIAPLDALARALGVLWNEITPSSSLKAYEIACQWLDEGVPFLARFRQPMIVWGYEKGIFESELKILRLEYHLPDQSLSRIECDRFDWRLQIDEGNSLLRVSHVESLTPDWMELLPIVVRRAIANWRHEPLDGVEIGLSAYKQFAEDLRNPQVDFADHGFPSWMGPITLQANPIQNPPAPVLRPARPALRWQTPSSLGQGQHRFWSIRRKLERIRQTLRPRLRAARARQIPARPGYPRQSLARPTSPRRGRPLS